MWPHENFFLLAPVVRLDADVNPRNIFFKVYEFSMCNLLIVSPMAYPKRILFLLLIGILNKLMLGRLRMLFVVRVLSELFFLFFDKLLHGLVNMPWLTMRDKRMRHWLWVK